MKRKKTLVIIGVNPDKGNKGVAALAVSTLFILNKIAKAHDVVFDFHIVGPRYGQSIVKVQDETIHSKCILTVSIFRLKGIIKLFLNPKAFLSFFSYLKSDYVLCMGEGDSFSETYGRKRFHYIDDQHKMARLFGKKYILLPQTIGPFMSPSIKREAQISIEKAQIVLVRDRKSYDCVIQETEQKNVFEAIDVAFFMPFERKKFSGEQTHVGINVSALLWNGGYTQNNQFCLKCDYQNLIRSILNYFILLPNVKVYLVPHVLSADSNVENDYEVCSNLAHEYHNENLILAPFFLTPIMAKNYISGLDFFAGSRMHATIAAFSSEVPVYPMGYSRKFNGLFEDTLNYAYMGDLVNQDKNEILEGIKGAFEKREILAQCIQERMSTIVRHREQLLTDKLTETLELNHEANSENS